VAEIHEQRLIQVEAPYLPLVMALGAVATKRAHFGIIIPGIATV